MGSLLCESHSVRFFKHGVGKTGGIVSACRTLGDLYILIMCTDSPLCCQFCMYANTSVAGIRPGEVIVYCDWNRKASLLLRMGKHTWIGTESVRVINEKLSALERAVMVSVFHPLDLLGKCSLCIPRLTANCNYLMGIAYLCFLGDAILLSRLSSLCNKRIMTMGESDYWSRHDIEMNLFYLCELWQTL